MLPTRLLRLSLLALGALLASPAAATLVVGATLHPRMVSGGPGRPKVSPVSLILWPTRTGSKYAWGTSDNGDPTYDWKPDELSDLAKAAFETMAAAARAKRWDAPDHMAVIHSAGDGLVFASSARGGPKPIGKATSELCLAKDPASCAEQHAVAHVKKLKWNLGPGSKIAVYGRVGNGEKPGDLQPCERAAGQHELEAACLGLARVYKGKLVQ